jgi:phosphoglycolate phosphatase
MIRSVVFDLDGTLVDTIADIAASMNRALSLRNLPLPPPEAYPAMVGWGLRRLAQQALPADWQDDALVDQVCADAVAFYAKEPSLRSKPYPGIPELIGELHRRGMVQAVLTNKPDSVAALVVDAIFPGHPFVLIRGDRPGLPRKPDPALTREAMDAMGAAMGSTLFVGDSSVDVETGHGVGCPVVGVSWGFRGRKELEDAGADYIVDDAREILSILGRL